MNFSLKRLTRKYRFQIKSAVALMLCMVTLTSLTGVTSARNLVTVHEDSTVYSKYTMYYEAQDILNAFDIELGENDKYVFSGFENGEGDIFILRAFDVTVTADGTAQTVVMTDGTVADALDLAGITLADEDLINVSLNERVQSGTDIVVNRVTYQVEERTEEIPYEVIDCDIPEGVANVKKVLTVEGQNGEQLVTLRHKLVDGVIIDSEVINTKIITYPVSAQYECVREMYVGGVKKQLALNEEYVELDANGRPINYAYKVTGKATAYSALGRPTKLKPGCVAMDLSKYPRGTKLYIVASNGSYVYGYSVVADTGAFVHNGSGVLVDVFFNTYAESVAFGAKTVDVYVLN